jgi:hypothetical protein
MPDTKDYNAVLYEKLYSKLAVALGVGSQQDGGQIGESLLSIYNPGQYLPVGLNPIDNPEDDQEISQIFDTAPMFNFTYAPVNLRVSQAYNSILEYKVFPAASLSNEEKKKLDNARKEYEELAPKCDAAEDAYLDACIIRDKAIADQKNGTGDGPTPAMERAVQRAEEKWVAAGKIRQETNLAIMRQFEGREGAAFWSRLEARYINGLRKTAGGWTFPPVTLAPKYSSWFRQEGWTSFKFNNKDMDNQTTSTSIGVAGSMDGKFGIVNISGSGSFQEDQQYVKIQETNLTFSCELMRITISRNWMNPLLFNSRAWQFDKAAPVGKYSTGGSIERRIVPTGAFVTIPTTAILARNVEIEGKFQDTVEERMKREIAADASIGIGPFSISGKVSYRDEVHKVKGTISENKISIKDTQIIAVVSQVLPELPNPDPNLPWAN